MDGEVLTAWKKIAAGVVDGIAANAVGALVLAHEMARKRMSGWEGDLILKLQRWTHQELEIAVKVISAKSRAQIRRTPKTELAHQLAQYMKDKVR